MYYTGMSDGSAMTAAGPIKIFWIPGGASLNEVGYTRGLCTNVWIHMKTNFILSPPPLLPNLQLNHWKGWMTGNMKTPWPSCSQQRLMRGGWGRRRKIYIHTGLSDDLCCPTQLRVIIKYRTQKNAKIHHFMCYQDNIEMHFSSVISLKYWLFNQKTT